MNAKPTPRRILIADDDLDTRAIVSSAVSMMGFEPLEAKDGKEALRIFAEVHPDLAILDVMMPELSGIEVCLKIKSSPTGPHVPVIMLTARDTVKDKVTALEGGADDYLTKPFHYQELQARLKALLRVRELNLALIAKNEELQAMQEKLVAQERQLVANQIAGTAAHQLGQPLSAIMLNCHLVESLDSKDERYQKALGAISKDAKRMAELIEKLRGVDAAKTETYFQNTSIIDLGADRKKPKEK